MVVTSHASGLSICLAIRLMPADVRFLDDVFGVGARAEHAVGEAEQPAAQCFESALSRSQVCVHTLFSDTEDG